MEGMLSVALLHACQRHGQLRRVPNPGGASGPGPHRDASGWPDELKSEADTRFFEGGRAAVPHLFWGGADCVELAARFGDASLCSGRVRDPCPLRGGEEGFSGLLAERLGQLRQQGVSDPDDGPNRGG